MKLGKVNMSNIISKYFQYGMTMDGVLGDNENYPTVYTINPQCMTLMFFCKIGSHLEYVRQQVSLEWLYPHYGSKKVYFICPECGKRATILYNSVAAFVCRKCNKLANNGTKDDWQAQSHHLHPVMM